MEKGTIIAPAILAHRQLFSMGERFMRPSPVVEMSDATLSQDSHVRCSAGHGVMEIVGAV